MFWSHVLLYIIKTITLQFMVFIEYIQKQNISFKVQLLSFKLFFFNLIKEKYLNQYKYLGWLWNVGELSERSNCWAGSRKTEVKKKAMYWKISQIFLKKRQCFRSLPDTHYKRKNWRNQEADDKSALKLCFNSKRNAKRLLNFKMQ